MTPDKNDSSETDSPRPRKNPLDEKHDGRRGPAGLPPLDFPFPQSKPITPGIEIRPPRGY